MDLKILHHGNNMVSNISSNGINDLSSWYPWPMSEQFQSWYPSIRTSLNFISTTTCNTTLGEYKNAFNARYGSIEAKNLLAICYWHEECILNNLSDDIQANFNSAMVMLGLMPTLLATLGPTVGEISLLSAHRPLLSFLLSMGAPAIFPVRVFEYDDPSKALKKDANKLVIHRLSTRRAISLSCVEYILAAGSVINVVTNSLEIGRNSLLTWGCTTMFTPLLWSTLAGVIHIIAATSYVAASQLAKRRSRRSQVQAEDPAPAVRGSAAKAPLVAQAKEPMTMPINGNHNSCGFAIRMLQRETIICANRPESMRQLELAKIPRAAIFLNVVAGACGFIHITFGIMVFSSQLFISTSDALNQIVWRYLLSTAVCRIILLIELAGLRNVAEKGP